jgi:hypothetical protein
VQFLKRCGKKYEIGKGIQMKKLVTSLMLMVTLPIHATTMCAANDTVAIVLDPSINLTKISNGSSTWQVRGSYGTLYGISACLSTNKNQAKGGTVARLSDTNPNTNETKLVVGGEQNGKYCWCRLTHPALSRWTFLWDVQSAHGGSFACRSVCASDCSIYSDAIMRAGLFGSIGSDSGGN